MNFAYALSFLKPEMNTWLGVPPSVAKELPPLIAELAGYADGVGLDGAVATAEAHASKL